MLCGYEPFYGETEKELIEANKAANIDFSESEWGGISDEARDLILKMTAFEPGDRLTAKEALDHPWVKHHAGADGVANSTTSSVSATSQSRKNTTEGTKDASLEGACVIS